MSYRLKQVIEELDGGGAIIEDEDLIAETLNEDLGLNIHHDLVITTQETREIRGLLDLLTKSKDKYVRKSAKWCISRLQFE